jgi:hypothetical protein
MKTAVRNIIGDLVEKRLWPVAIVLLVSIVAVPLVLARGGTPTAGPVSAGVPGPAADAPAVRLDDSAPNAGARGGRVRNPFGTAADGASSTSASATPVSATTSGGSGSASGSSPSGASTSAVAVHPAIATGSSTPVAPAPSPSTGAPSGSATHSATPPPANNATTPKTTTTTSPKTDTSVTYSVAVRFGRTDGKRRTLRNIARLTTLPSAKAPVVSILGVLRDGRTVVLRVAPAATASGNGACKSSTTDCAMVEMKAGDAEYFRVAGAGGTAVAWYYLKLLHVDRHETSSKAVAAAAYARRSAAGMAVVRRAATSVRAYRYLPGLGVLVRAEGRTRHTPKAATAARVQPLLVADEQPGVAAWRSVPRRAKR